MAKDDGKPNAIQLKNLEAGFHSDGRGLYLDVQPSGSRSWILRTMVKGKRRDIGLGGLATVSLADAREDAQVVPTGIEATSERIPFFFPPILPPHTILIG